MLPVLLEPVFALWSTVYPCVSRGSKFSLGCLLFKLEQVFYVAIWQASLAGMDLVFLMMNLVFLDREKEEGVHKFRGFLSLCRCGD
jgi:hypothetical protein